MIDYSFGYETNDGHHGLGVSEAAPPAAFTVRRHDTENPNAYEEIVYRPERTCRIEWRGQVIETEHSIDCDGEYYCTACGDALPKWADGAWDDYQAARFDGEPPFRHCPFCGAKVVG